VPYWAFLSQPLTPGCRSSVSLKTPLFIAEISVACIVLFFSLSISLSIPFSVFSPTGESCLVLIVDESQDDFFIQETLSSLKLGDFVSESSQLVAVDDFGSLRYIPLESFQNEIEAFDPRDDGYARKVGSFFVHEGKRFFFKLVETESRIRIGKIKKEVNSLLENIPYSFVVLAPRGFNFPYIVLQYAVLIFAASALALFVSRYRRLFVFQIPVLLLFAPSGFYSLVLAAILAGIWELLREPLGELSAAFHYRRSYWEYAGAGIKGIMEGIKPFRKNLYLVLLLLLLFAAFSFFGIITPIFLGIVLVLFALLCFIALKVEAERVRRNRHILFTPVMLLPQKVKTYSFFPLLLPFALISLFALFLPQAYPELNINPVEQRYLIRAEEYEQHIDFQHSFSFRPMNHEPSGFQALNKIEYLGYYLGEDGLIAGSFDNRDEAENSLFKAEMPFPLESLMDFLIEYNNLTVGRDGIVNHPVDGMKDPPIENKVKEFISVAIIAAVCIMDFLRPLFLPKKKIPISGDKRVAA